MWTRGLYGIFVATLAGGLAYGAATAPEKPREPLSEAAAVADWQMANQHSTCDWGGCLRTDLISAELRGSTWCFTSQGRSGRRLDGADVEGIRWEQTMEPQTWCYPSLSEDGHGHVYWGQGEQA